MAGPHAHLQLKFASSKALQVVAALLTLFLCYLSGTAAADAEAEVSLPTLSGCQGYTSDDIAFIGPQLSTSAGSPPSTFSYHRFGPLLRTTTTSSQAPAARPLVLLMGYGANMYVWSIPLLKALAQHREVVIFNYPGIGNSSSFSSNATPSSNTSLTFNQLADHVVDFMTALQLPQTPDLLGWSLGGTTALAIVTRHPDAVNNIISVSASAGGPLSPVSGLGNSMDLEQISTNITLLLEFLLPPHFQQPATCNIVASLRAFEPFGALRPISVSVLMQYAAANQFLSCDNIIFAALPNVTNRVLFVHGQQDAVIPVTAALAAARQVPGAWQAVFSNAGHVLPQSYPERVAAVVDAFLGTVDKMSTEAAKFIGAGVLPKCEVA
jgi:pimeloyl-ACP methyl ester carboxylesterase